MKSVIVFDGDCGICSFLVTSTFHLTNVFNVRPIYYAPLKSELGDYLLTQALSRQIVASMSNGDTMVFFDRGKLYMQSEALIRCYARSSRLSILLLLLIIPPTFRDTLYQILASCRIKVSKALNISASYSCGLDISPKLRSRIIINVKELQ